MSQNNSYFNFITTGVGYLNDIRTVSKHGGLACKIAALVGKVELDEGEKREYRFIQCNVHGALAKGQLAVLQKAADDKKKVLVAFSVGEISAHQFTYEKGEKKGQTGLVLKARLVKLSSAKVDGVDVALPAPASDATPAPAEVVAEVGQDA